MQVHHILFLYNFVHTLRHIYMIEGRTEVYQMSTLRKGLKDLVCWN